MSATPDPCPHDRLAEAGEACAEILSRDEVNRRRQLERVRRVRAQLRKDGGR